MNLTIGEDALITENVVYIVWENIYIVQDVCGE